MTKTLVANYPQSVQAFQIVKVSGADSKTSQREIGLANGTAVKISQVQTNQYLPSVGDYYVVPSEGHPFCTPKSTFVQTYTVGS